MNTFDAFLASVASPLDVLAGFDRQAARDAGVKPATVDEWERVHAVYYGTTRFTRKQAHAIRIARESGKSLDQLVLIENQLKAVTPASETWRLRLALLSVHGDYNTLKRRAKTIIPDPDADTPAPESTVRFSTPKKGKRSFTATGDDSFIAALEYALRRNLDPGRPAGPQMYEALTDILRGEGGVADAVPRPLVVVPLTEHTRILRGEGNDTILGLSNGTTMTGAEYLARFHGEDLEVAIFHPQAGAVNLYDTKRFANAKQRDLARATLTTCPVPGCRHAADNCEVHHVTAWSRGGQTNMNNLAVVCRYHNRTNDDNPNRKHRGRIEIRAGTPVWVSPRGRPAPNTTHQYGAMHLLFGKQRE
ncbi:HNH endonuclease signature motif containing protein [Corynebacterium urinipleomorphum]|uniref:HNH endonuclease signature motif containing protein n=1 Tax=Corynebacterium urinipleomorphum TaxID=1852380 RepID=UPI0011775FD0|nr:HNH endonuclease signature motif containing protein [Corynebacterium urinipleomorphum]